MGNGESSCSWSRRRYKRKRQIEAAEACKWLRAAGFPQYSQLYEAAEFPIDLSTVEKDHEFLDSVELQSLFRRLETLNKCAAMKLDPTIKKSSSDSDEEDYALSNKWTFERPSRRWSRIETSSSGVEVLRSCSSRDSVSAEQSSTQNSPTTPSKTELVVPEVVRESQSTVGSLLSPRLRRAATEKLKGAKNILKRVESLRHSKNKKKKKEKSGSSSPTPEASPSSPIHQLVNTPKRSSRPFASDSSSYTTAFSHLSIDSQESVLHLDSSSEVVRRPDRGQQEASDEHKRSSLYDNLETVSNDAQNQFDMILQDLQRDINALDESLNGKKGAAMPMPKITCDTEKVEQEIDRLSEKTSASSYTPSGGQDSSENDTQHSPTTEKRERRDSGVGLSLTRVPSARRRQAAIWHSFLGYTIQEKITGDGVDMRSLCVGQLLVLKKMAMLKLSSRIDTHAPPGTRLNWDSFVPKFMRRCKSTTSAAQKHVFGVPLHMIEQRTGDPLPQPISKAMSFILEHCSNSYAVGLFRKNGQQTRIQQMKNEIECGGGFRDHYEISSLLDTCDLVKSFFRELPECLFTNRYSPMILSIFKHLPKDNWLELTQASILLLPDENRRVLRALASFLLQISRHHLSNGMTEHNLAVCIAPNLFPPLTSSTVHGKTMADSKEVQDQKAAIDCVRFIIENAEELFTISKATYEESSAKVEQYNPSPYEVVRDCGHLKNAIDVLFKEHLDKWKNYDSAVPTMRAPGVDISLKKVSDGYPLRLWKSSAEITAPPNEVLERILHERHIWDERILETEVLETTDNDSDVICYILDGSRTMPRSVVCTMRHWTKDIGKGMCALVSTSVHHRKAKNFDDAECRVVFAERFLIEPCGSGKSLVTSLYRVDIRGHSSDWYKRQGGVEMAHLLSNLRDSFRSRIEGPETKV